jgi:zeaxanthin glucosyltransferase
MKQTTVLFVIPAAKGHLHPSFGLARILQNAGYQILFALPSMFQSYIIQHGFHYVPLEGLPFASNGEKRMDESSLYGRVRYLDSIMDRFYDNLYKIRRKRFEILISEHKPDIILLDSFQSSDFVILYPLLKQNNIRFAFLQIMLSYLQQPGSLPLNCAVIPNSKTNFNLHWKLYYFKRFLNSIGDNIRYLGKSNTRIIEEKFRMNKISNQYSINTNQVFRVGFNNIPEFITTPRELEFTESKSSSQVYLGSIIDSGREIVEDSDFSSFIDKIPLYRNVVYCSLGTIYTISKKNKEIITFFSQLLEVAKILTDFEFVLSLTKEYSLKLGEIPHNVHFFEQVPQLKVLSRADIFITHGGSQSVKESIRNHVPMLVYPIWWDQPGFAARVEYFGLGLTGKLGKDSSQQIRDKIKVLTNDNSYRQNVIDLDEIIVNKYTEHSILKDFENTLKNQVIT